MVLMCIRVFSKYSILIYSHRTSFVYMCEHEHRYSYAYSYICICVIIHVNFRNSWGVLVFKVGELCIRLGSVDGH